MARFRKDPSIAYTKADNILYRFGDENNDVREYIIRKIELY
jgi:hypothetical protein